jgi:maltose O-acetyltransferase
MIGIEGLRSRLWEDPRVAALADGWDWCVAHAEMAAGMIRAPLVLHDCEVERMVAVLGAMRVRNQGELCVGHHSLFIAGSVPSDLRVHRGARLSIGHDSILNYGVRIDAHAGVTIGHHAMVGSFAQLNDRDGPRIAPITIGDRVWIAHGARIGPGVSIGDGAVVSAGARVDANVPPESLAIGDPARMMPLSMVSSGEGVSAPADEAARRRAS